MQFKNLSLAALLAVASAESSQSVVYEVETQTQLSTTEVTITSCADDACTATVETVSYTVVTTTVDGISTEYTTICPETESTSSPTAVEAVESVAPVASSSESDIYVDVTITPTVQATTSVEATVTSQSTFTSIYNSKNSSAVAAVSTFVGEGSSPKVMMGAVGLAGLAAVLL